MIPYDSEAASWADKLSELGLFQAAEDYTPKPGDLMFTDWDDDGKIDHVGIVRGPVGAAQAAQMNGLQQVGFPCAVFPHNDRHALWRGQQEAFIAAEILQPQRFEPHGSPSHPVRGAVAEPILQQPFD